MWFALFADPPWNCLLNISSFSSWTHANFLKCITSFTKEIGTTTSGWGEEKNVLALIFILILPWSEHPRFYVRLNNNSTSLSILSTLLLTLLISTLLPLHSLCCELKSLTLFSHSSYRSHSLNTYILRTGFPQPPVSLFLFWILLPVIKLQAWLCCDHPLIHLSL